jgi:hypothetical protein
MRRSLVFLAALVLAPAAWAQGRPGPTPLAAGVAPGGLAAVAGDIPLDRRVRAEMMKGAPTRSRTPVLKGGKMRPSTQPLPLPAPSRRPASKTP